MAFLYYYLYSPTKDILVKALQQLQSPQAKTLPTCTSSNPLFAGRTPILTQERHP